MAAFQRRAFLHGVALCATILSGPAEAQDAAALRARHTALSAQLAGSSFGRPLHIESSGNSSEQKGEIYATIEQAYDVVARALGRVDPWCGILILQVNVKSCEASRTETGGTVTAFVSRRPDDPLDSAHRVHFSYDVAAAGVDYLRVALNSPDGPLGTTNYKIGVEAAPLDTRRTFVHMSYSYNVGIMARMAMQGYLATSGRGKVGFSVAERLPDGRPVYVDGLRGVIERNAMRHYLAVDAYLGALEVPPSQQLEKRLRDWYASIDQYPQLREAVGRDEYLQMKRREANRHRAG